MPRTRKSNKASLIENQPASKMALSGNTRQRSLTDQTIAELRTELQLIDKTINALVRLLKLRTEK